MKEQDTVDDQWESDRTKEGCVFVCNCTCCGLWATLFRTCALHGTFVGGRTQLRILKDDYGDFPLLCCCGSWHDRACWNLLSIGSVQRKFELGTPTCVGCAHGGRSHARENECSSGWKEFDGRSEKDT